MQIYPITNYSNYRNNVQLNKKNVAFEGVKGDHIVRRLAQFDDVKVSEVMQELKGTFGPKSEKVEDVIESFIAALKERFSKEAVASDQIKVYQSSLERAEQRIKEAEDEVSDVREAFSGALKAKTAALKEKEEELKKAQEIANKYKPMASVKSVDELGVIMPDEVIKVAQEMQRNKSNAAQSMMNFLLSGKGQEEALAQIERNNILQRARLDHLDDIPGVSAAFKQMNDNGVYPNVSHAFIIGMIKNSLLTCPKGDYILSNTMGEQIKKNATAILLPNIDEKCLPHYVGEKSNVSKFVESQIDEIIKEVKDFHKTFPDAKQAYLSEMNCHRDGIKNVEFVSVPGSPYETGYLVTYENENIQPRLQNINQIVANYKEGYYR